MDSVLETIRAAVANDATAEQKAAGVQACRTIIAALDAEPGKPLVAPIAVSAPTRPSLDQILDMAIARLTMIANAHDTSAVAPATQNVSAVPRQLPAGLRVPTAPAALPPSRPAKQPARKPAPTRKV
ncbi:MAG: hypothetical protein AB7T06_45370 [Kofleriaceae bacterium]